MPEQSLVGEGEYWALRQGGSDPPRLAFDVWLERNHYHELEQKYGKQQAYEISVRRLYYQLESYMAEGLRTPLAYRRDLEVTCPDGSKVFIPVGDEALGDIRNLTEETRKRYPQVPRFHADCLGWTELYDRLETAEDYSVGVLISPGDEYDLIYLVQVGSQDTPHTRLVHKVMVICNLESEHYAKMIDSCLKTDREKCLNPELAVIQRQLAPQGVLRSHRWLYDYEFLYFPQMQAPQDLAELWHKLRVAAGVAGRDGLPTDRQIRQIIGKEDNPELAGYIDMIKQGAVFLTETLVRGVSLNEAQRYVDNLVRQPIKDRYRAEGRCLPPAVKICGGKLLLDDEEMMEKRVVFGKTQYRCLGCGHWITLESGFCPHCGYRFKCGGRRPDRKLPLGDFISFQLRYLFADKK